MKNIDPIEVLLAVLVVGWLALMVWGCVSGFEDVAAHPELTASE